MPLEGWNNSISMPLLVVVVSWLAIMFISVGLYAPPNFTVIVALMLAAMSVAGARAEMSQASRGANKATSSAIASRPCRTARPRAASPLGNGG